MARLGDENKMNNAGTEGIPERKFDPTLRDLLVPLFRRKKLLTVIFSGLFLGSVLAALMFSSQHEAKMEILVNQERLDPKVSSETTLPTPTAPPPVTDEQINSEVELLQSPDLLQQVVIANGLQNRERKGPLSRIFPQEEDAWYIAKATDHLGKRLRIAVVPKTNMIQVSYKAADPHLAYAVMQKLSEFYLAKHLAAHRPQGSYAFFSSQTDKYRQALEESEARLADFGKESGVVAPDLVRAETAQQVVNATGALHAAQQAIAADKRRIEDVEARMKLTPDRSATLQITASAQTLLQQLHADLLAAELKKTQLLMKYDPSYPLVREAEQEIAQTQAAIADAAKQQYVNQTTDRDPTYELMREDIARARADLASQQATATALETTIQSLQQQMVDVDQKALRQSDLAREVKANEANYLLYLSKREQERTSDALDEQRIGNVAIAVPPTLPILPARSPVLVLLVGVMLAAFASTTAVFVAEYLNPALRTPDEVLEVLRIPVLASVPKQTA
jgi:uncharacterized protein involved in exopolysaccharide biosynthesis